ncbi:MOSC N-terminal beta barrel domain-containing protein [Amycolatopsis anabasis]|uniref:MOSC N-terminal beta barrel domain-containing protein n=1 Tax=Amycolatopsis anabasis TaxID=1840409 RepID=UPI0015D39BE8
MARIVDLVHYPVKGCAGKSLPAADVTPAGLAHDRTFMAVAPDGRFRSQRQSPVMAVIKPELSADGGRLRLTAPGVEDLDLAVAFDGRRLVVQVFAWEGKGVDQGDEAADWFSTVLGQESRLVRVPPDHTRVASGETPGTAGFADGHAILVASESSLDSLNERIAAAGGEAVPMDRFRPNLIVRGWAEPHAEDRVRAMRAGTAEFGYARVCTRCTVPMVDQETGRKAGPEPIRSLARYRRSAEGPVEFGMKAAVTRPGQVAVGDEVIVHSWAAG